MDGTGNGGRGIGGAADAFVFFNAAPKRITAGSNSRDETRLNSTQLNFGMYQLLDSRFYYVNIT